MGKHYQIHYLTGKSKIAAAKFRIHSFVIGTAKARYLHSETLILVSIKNRDLKLERSFDDND